jgi:cell wall-associated NlpC family hydrolase
MPRTTAQGIYEQCDPISADGAQAGDLIFFTNTYNCPDTVSHIGLYVGEGRMLHCGSPIGYASIDTTYWQQHFYGYARIKLTIDD